MENQLNQLISSVCEKTTHGHSAERAQQTFSQQEYDATGYFFANIKLIYPRDYAFDIEATAEREKMIKRANAKQIGKFNKTQIDKGMGFIRAQKRNCERNYMRLDVDIAIGALIEANRNRASYRALPPPTGRQVTNEDAVSLFAAMRSDIGFDKAEPEAELAARGVVTACKA